MWEDEIHVNAAMNMALRGCCVLGAGILLGCVAGVLLFSAPSVDGGHALRVADPAYPLIKPLLACNIDSTAPSLAYDALQAALKDEIGRATTRGDISRAGVYVRNLSNGLWTSVNGDDEFYPASLMKIVTLITYLRSADSDPTILDKQITVTSAEAAVDQNLRPEMTAVVGETYTVAELLRLLIVYSDNIASNALVDHIVPSSLNVVLADLQIPQYADNTMYMISPRFYSRLLRILYNSTFLSGVHSEFALELLQKSAYADALVAGIDPSETVAHKFGEASLEDPAGAVTYQHHDCGIVYAKDPYVVCVMTEGGKDIPTLAKTISSLAAIVDRFMKTP